MPADYAHDW